jgi:hypothetical protein
MKKNKLVIDYEFDFQLLGIISSAKGYKLAWHINHQLNIQLVKQDDLIVGFKKADEKSFAHYSYETRLNRLKLFKNKPMDADSGKYYLVPEFPHFDFIILTQMEENSLQAVLPQLREIPSIELLAPISLEGLKSKSNFIF